MYIKSLLILLSVFLVFSSCKDEGRPISELDYNKDDKVYILVRHAEKDTGENPPLTEEGIARANKLAIILKPFTIDEIYTSNFLRTIQTILPISGDRKIEPKKYNPKNHLEFSKELINKPAGTYLISGHSNSTPILANDLCSCDYYKNIEETDFTNIFVVILSPDGEKQTLNFTY